MIILRPVISVREIPPNCASSRSQFPSLRSLVSEQPRGDEAKILQYLQQGVFGCFYPDAGLGRDVLEPGKKVDRQLSNDALGLPSASAFGPCSSVIEPSSVLTDGVWLWPGVLAYYVARYHVQVDPQFIDHARANNWTIQQAEVRLENLSFDAFSNDCR
jgi:hypothetical protein